MSNVSNQASRGRRKYGKLRLGIALIIIQSLFFCMFPRSAAVSDLAPTSLAQSKEYGYAQKLCGVTAMDWETWTMQEADREILDIKAHGFNFVRIPVYFHRFIDWNSLAFDSSKSQEVYDRLVHFMGNLAKNKLFVEPIPMEPWNFGNKMEFWWTNLTLQKRIVFFYRTYAEWLKNMDWNNIVCVTVWAEATYYHEWVDGAFALENQIPNYGEANQDWKTWLTQNGETPLDLTLDSINQHISQYTAWSRDRFNLITRIKADAVKEGWPECPVAGEIGYIDEKHGTGPPYHPSRYLQLSAKSFLDILCEHDYADSVDWTFKPYLSGTGEKHVLADEIGPPFYLNVYANNTQQWFDYMVPKMELALTRTMGFCIWCWKDYDERAWGLKDKDFKPRPILQMVSDWLTSSNPAITPKVGRKLQVVIPSSGKVGQ